MKRTSRDREEVTIRNQIEPSSIGHLQILTVTTRDIDKFFTKLLAEKKLSASSIDKVRHALDPAFRWAVDNKQIPENPMNPIRKEIVDSIETLKKKGADDDLTPWKDPKDYICLTRYKGNYTATSMEKIVNTVYRNAGLGEHASGLHILRRTFATNLYNQGYTIKDIAAYLGDLESTVSKYYIASRKKKEVNGKMVTVVELKKK